MSIKDRLAGKSATIGMHPRTTPDATDLVPQRAKTAPGQLMASLPFLAEKEEEIVKLDRLNAELREKLSVAEQNTTGKKIRLAELHEVAGRRRKLSSVEYGELKNNLAKHPLTTPVTVRKRQGGGYEIISGHNRVAIYKELGREEILAIIQDFDDSTSELSALFANLFHPTLPDVQKFRAFKRLQDITGKNQKLLAEESGADPQSISRLMSFDKLPEIALSMIEENPDKIGATAATAFAQLANQGKETAVVAAVKAIIEGTMTQESGVRIAKMGGQGKEKLSPPETVSIRSGKQTYCKMMGTKKMIRLDFRTEDERIGMESAIKEFLEKAAKGESL